MIKGVEILGYSQRQGALAEGNLIRGYRVITPITRNVRFKLSGYNPAEYYLASAKGKSISSIYQAYAGETKLPTIVS